MSASSPAGPSRPPPPSIGVNGVDTVTAASGGPAPPFTADATNSGTLTDQQRAIAFQQQKMRAAQAQMSANSPVPPTPSANTVPGPPSSATTPIRPPAQPGTPATRPQNGGPLPKQFMHSLRSFYTSHNTKPPPELFGTEHPGAIFLGGAKIEMAELFFMVMKQSGIQNIVKWPSDHPMWTAFLQARGVPNPLPEPVQLPRPPAADASVPTQTTTDPVQYLTAAYYAWLFGFETWFYKSKWLQLQKDKQAATGERKSSGDNQAAASPKPDPTGATFQTPISAPSPAVAQLPGAAVKQEAVDVPTGNGPASTSQPGSGGPGTPATGTSDSGLPNKKRKRERTAKEGSVPSTPVSATPAPARPPTPKRQRYKVEYRPLHFPQPTMAGWDERSISSLFPKNSLQNQTKSIHELSVVDMEAVLMGLRSRIPREVAYGLTILSMLSMPHPQDNVAGLPIQHLSELFLEMLELMQEAAFGEDGYDAWLRIQEAASGPSRRKAACLSYGDLERLARDVDYTVPDDTPDSSSTRHCDRTGGQTDVIFATLNLLRNLSHVSDNQSIMASSPELLITLARLADDRLCRLPGEGSARPYSVSELARVRRDVANILSNIGVDVRLQQVPLPAVQSIFQVLASFLVSAHEQLAAPEAAYGPSVSLRDYPPAPIILSVYTALEAFDRIATHDRNREVLSRLPASGLVEVYEGLIRLLPVSRRDMDALHHFADDFLGFYETVAHSLYSLVFLATSSTRQLMRSVPGTLATLSRFALHTASWTPDYKVNQFAVLSRRLCETLGVLNGTVSASVGVGSISFSANSGDGKGWKFASEAVQAGWMAQWAERIGEVCTVRGLEREAFQELDKNWWAPTALD